MTNNHMRLLTEQELQSIYEGNIFTSIWNWIKKHLLCPTFGVMGVLKRRKPLNKLIFELIQTNMQL